MNLPPPGPVDYSQPPRIGLIRNIYPELQQDETNQMLETAAETLRQGGATVDDVMFPDDFELAWSSALIISLGEGAAINAGAADDIRVLVVGNPANTNALIARANAPDLNPRNFTAMTRLDHNRGLSQLAEKTGAHTTDIRRFTIWGNHSSTQYPDISHATVAGKPAKSLVDQKWVEETFIPVVQQRGAAIIKARGASSAASAAAAAIDHVHTWVKGTADGDWVSMAVPSDGSYGIKEGLVYSYPVTTRDGEYSIVQGLSVDEFSRGRMDLSEKELREERDGVKDLL